MILGIKQQLDWQSRARTLIGDKGIDRLRQSRILIAGIGGVGSHCTEALARAGVGALTLIDHDQVSVTNLNRQLPALHSTIGQLKTDVMRLRIADINPECLIETHPIRLTAESIPSLISKTHDYDAVIDCIDEFEAKAALLEQTDRCAIAAFSSMGAGKRLNPSAIRTAVLAKTTVCPLARRLRIRWKNNTITQRIMTVYSVETPCNTPKGTASHAIGSISYMPALFGYTLAGLVIERLLSR